MTRAWSYSALSEYEQCPAKYKYAKIDRLPQPQTAAMARGNEIHKLAEAYLSRTLTELPAELKKFSASFEYLKELNPVVEQKWAFTQEWKSTQYFAKNVWLRAVCDVVVLYPDNTAMVIDHKTGKRYGENADQIELFALATMAQYPQVQTVETRLWYLDTGDEVTLNFGREKWEAQKKTEWQVRANRLQQETEFAATPNDKCRWCHYRRSNDGPCQYG